MHRATLVTAFKSPLKAMYELCENFPRGIRAAVQEREDERGAAPADVLEAAAEVTHVTPHLIGFRVG